MLFDLLFYSALVLFDPKMAAVINQADRTSQVQVQLVSSQPPAKARLINDPRKK